MSDRAAGFRIVSVLGQMLGRKGMPELSDRAAGFRIVSVLEQILGRRGDSDTRRVVPAYGSAAASGFGPTRSP